MMPKPYLAIFLLWAVSLYADEGLRELTPGQAFSIRFPEMPATFAELLDKKGIEPMMTVFLPRNYERQRKHPLLIFLGGGGGTRGQNPGVARKLTEETDFICVDLPLFKEHLAPPATGNATSRLIIQGNDGKFMWPFYKTMLAKLEAAVPNIDPARRILGGFSNGAHATAALIDESDGEVARRFSAFVFGEGGGRLQGYGLLKGKEFLMLYGSERSGKRAREIYEAAVAAGAKATLREMKGVGHAFPESQYPMVRAWLRGEAKVPGDEGKLIVAEEGKVAEQTKTGTVAKVDVDGGHLSVETARELTFTVTSKTRISRGSEARKLGEIKAGDTVSVTYVKEGDRRTASKIEILNGKVPASAPAKAAARVPQPGDSQISLQVGSQTRTCLLHVPPAHNNGRLLPLVIAFHGSGGNGAGMARITGFSDLADKHGFVVAYPDAIIGKGLWNTLFGTLPGGAGVLADEVDDVAFVRELINSLEKSYHVDPRRVFVCGHSAGAYMSYRLAVELSDRVAAAGAVNGSLGIKSLDGKPVQLEIPKPVGPVSIIHICGKKDNAVKFGGAQTPKNLFKSVPDCIRFFVKANGCAATGKETCDAERAVMRTLYSDGRAGTEVELVVVENCGHDWPSPSVGLSASRELWRFFAEHPKASR